MKLNLKTLGFVIAAAMANSGIASATNCSAQLYCTGGTLAGQNVDTSTYGDYCECHTENNWLVKCTAGGQNWTSWNWIDCNNEADSGNWTR